MVLGQYCCWLCLLLTPTNRRPEQQSVDIFSVLPAVHIPRVVHFGHVQPSTPITFLGPCFPHQQ